VTFKKYTLIRAVIDTPPDVSDPDITQGAEPFYTDAHNFELIEAARVQIHCRGTMLSAFTIAAAEMERERHQQKDDGDANGAA
jgi:hypothetical protein